jgi:hypothetical protein
MAAGLGVGGWHLFMRIPFLLFSYPIGILLSGWFAILKFAMHFKRKE